MPGLWADDREWDSYEQESQIIVRQYQADAPQMAISDRVALV